MSIELSKTTTGKENPASCLPFTPLSPPLLEIFFRALKEHICRKSSFPVTILHCSLFLTPVLTPPYFCCSPIQLNETYLAILTLFTPASSSSSSQAPWVVIIKPKRRVFFLIKAMTLSSLPHLAWFFFFFFKELRGKRKKEHYNWSIRLQYVTFWEHLSLVEVKMLEFELPSTSDGVVLATLITGLAGNDERCHLKFKTRALLLINCMDGYLGFFFYCMLISLNKLL